MPVRKVKLKDGTVGYQWGTTGKIYKKREDAEKQGIAILLSKRKKRKMKINKELYNELKEKVNSLEKLVNGGKGSGNFGHAGRPGEVGGSAPSGTAPQGKTIEKRAYDYLRNNYTELGFDGSLVDTDFADDKAMTIFSSLESSDIMQLAEDKVKADDIYYSLEGNINKYYKEGRDNASNLQSYMQKTNDSINEAINEVMSYGKALARASQLPEDTKKDFWLMDKDERSNPGNRARTLLDDAERRLLRHEFDSEGFTEFAKVSQQRIQTLREVITNYDEINERVLDAPRSDKIIQDPTKKNFFVPTPQQLAKSLNGGKGSGNFGHAGRPGKIGGSAPEGAASAGQSTSDSAWAWAKQLQQEYLEKVTKHLEQARGDFYRDYQRYELVDGQYVKKQPDMNDEAYKAALKKIEDSVDKIRALNVKSEDLQTQKDNAKIARIEEKIGKKALLVAKDFEGGSASTFMDEDGKEYWYDKRSERVKDYGGEKEYHSPAFDKAMKDKTPWNEYEITGAQIKKKLKGYGINTEGLTVSKSRGGYETAWHISGDSRKTDLKAVEDIVKTKIGHVDYDERSGEILAGGNTFVFVSDTDKNMLYQKLSNKLDKLALALNGGEGSN